MVAHPSLPIRYIVMMYGIPTSNNVNYNGFNVPYHIAQMTGTINGRSGPGYSGTTSSDPYSVAEYGAALVSSLDCGDFDATNAYIGKLAAAAAVPGALASDNATISGTASGYGGTNWVLDDTRDERYYSYSPQFPPYATVVAAAFPGTDPATIIEYSSNTPVLVVSSNDAVTYENGRSIVQTAKDVTFYGGWGQHNRYFSPYWPTDNSVTFSGRSNWFAVEPIESFCGMYVSHGWQSTYEEYFAANTFGGTDYSHTAITFVGYTSEPGLSGVNDSKYAAYWATGRTSAEAAWGSSHSQYFLFVGDPLVTR